MVLGMPIFCSMARMAVEASLRATPGAKIEGNGDRGILTLVIHRQGSRGRLVMRDGAERDDSPLRGPDINVVQVHGRLPELGSDFQHHVVLVDAGKHGRNLGLAEGFVEGIVEHLRSDAEA